MAVQRENRSRIVTETGTCIAVVSVWRWSVSPRFEITPEESARGLAEIAVRGGKGPTEITDTPANDGGSVRRDRDNANNAGRFFDATEVIERRGESAEAAREQEKTFPFCTLSLFNKRLDLLLFLTLVSWFTAAKLVDGGIMWSTLFALQDIIPIAYVDANVLRNPALSPFPSLVLSFSLSLFNLLYYYIARFLCLFFSFRFGVPSP